MTTPEIPVPLFLQAIRRRPEIWSTAPQQLSDEKRAAYWKQICRSTWPEFNSWTTEQKRIRCLRLQKKWKTLQEDFTRAQQEGNSAQKCAHHDLLTFLTVDKKKPSIVTTTAAGAPPAKRARTEVAAEECTEDRHFLLSLESHMRDVPHASKLALREDMLRLVRKYNPQPTTTAASDFDITNSQEY